MIGHSPFDCEKGGKGSVTQQPVVAPEPPVEEASVDIEDDEDTKKKGRASLKIPLGTQSGVGLKV